MSTSLSAEKSYRVLWSQVVLQAKEDLEREPMDSLLYDQAEAFFVGRGEWAESRANIADCLEIHPDDLTRCGERWIAGRRARDGLAPTPPPSQPASVAQQSAPLPRLEAAFAPERCDRKAARRRVSGAVNPFNPHRAYIAG